MSGGNNRLYYERKKGTPKTSSQEKAVLQDFIGLIPDVGATLVVALNWADTRPDGYKTRPCI
jgi:hypothetical protein